jgi:hypothetical protein
MNARTLAALAIVAGCSKTGAGGGATELARDKEIVASAKQADAAMDAIRRDALVKAKGTVVPRPDLGACPVRWEPHLAPKTSFDGDAATNTAYWNVPRWDPSDASIAGLFPMHMEDEMVSIERLGIAFADEVAQKPGPRHFRIESDAYSLPLGPRTRDTLTKVVDATYEPDDYELVIDDEIAARPAADGSFVPGVLAGRFYVFDHPKRAVVCAADVVVRSSADIRFAYTAQFDRKTYTTTSDDKAKRVVDALRGDLRERALVFASGSLFAAGPPVATPADGGARADAAAR